MIRTLDKYLWVLLVAVGVAVTVACSASTTGGEEEGGAPDALTQG
jgi:hypothetical protein